MKRIVITVEIKDGEVSAECDTHQGEALNPNEMGLMLGLAKRLAETTVTAMAETYLNEGKEFAVMAITQSYVDGITGNADETSRIENMSNRVKGTP